LISVSLFLSLVLAVISQETQLLKGWDDFAYPPVVAVSKNKYLDYHVFQ